MTRNIFLNYSNKSYNPSDNTCVSRVPLRSTTCNSSNVLWTVSCLFWFGSSSSWSTVMVTCLMTLSFRSRCWFFSISTTTSRHSYIWSWDWAAYICWWIHSWFKWNTVFNWCNVRTRLWTDWSTNIGALSSIRLLIKTTCNSPNFTIKNRIAILLCNKWVSQKFWNNLRCWGIHSWNVLGR